MGNRKRSAQVIVCMVEEERVFVEEKMKQLPTQNLSAYTRKMLIDGYIILFDTPEIKAHTTQLLKINVNINQIARRANEQAAFTSVKLLIADVWKSEQRLLLQLSHLTN